MSDNNVTLLVFSFFRRIYDLYHCKIITRGHQLSHCLHQLLEHDVIFHPGVLEV